MHAESIYSIIYHDIFDFPLTKEELVRWSSKLKIENSKLKIENQGGYYFLTGRADLVTKRVNRKKIFVRKMAIARKAAKVLELLPTIRMVAVTGALAMANAAEGTDIDLLLITHPGTLWLTRLIVFGLLSISGFKLRRFGDSNQKDKLCLNMWLTTGYLVWPVRDRNIYSAHEIGQIVPLVNKNKTYELFLSDNRWIKNYWPNIIA